jgi:hypothetical protein
MQRIALTFLAAALVAGAAAPAEAFWVARGWRGGVAVGGFRAPIVARDAFYPRCWRCAPVYPAGAVAGAALAGAALGAAAAGAAAPVAMASPSAPMPAPPPAAAAPDAAAAAPPPGNAPAATKVAAANPAADKCAQGLPADSKMIYDASIKAMTSLATLRDTVTSQTRSLVMSGKISQDAARPAAEKAGTCLRLLAQ